MQKFTESSLTPPINLSWMFLFLCEIVWEAVALKFKAACAVEGMADQKIRENVNADLKRLCKIALKKEVSRDTLKSYKVISSVSRAYDIAVHILLPQPQYAYRARVCRQRA
jgi:hypothetical protein